MIAYMILVWQGWAGVAFQAAVILSAWMAGRARGRASRPRVAWTEAEIDKVTALAVEKAMARLAEAQKEGAR